METSNTQQPSVAIIGAGCSGLAAIKMLREAGLNNIVCFEKNDQLGGNWVYSEKEGHSSVCETTHIISSKKLSVFSDFPMPADYPDYPSHRQLLRYFQDYAEQFDLKRFIRFNTAVESAVPLPDQGWNLSFSDGSSAEFDYLLVANGHHSVPRHPDWKDDFKGRYLHAHAFKHNRGFEKQRVLVVGAGNSACDCAVEISRVNEQVDISVRTPQYIVPKFFMGRATDSFAAVMSRLPRPVQDVLQRISLRIQVGRYRDYGLPEPDFPVTHAHPTMNSELLERIRHGRVRPRPGVDSIDGQTVRFTDGTSTEYDTIVAATGYEVKFPFFPESFLSWENATRIPLYLRVFHPEHPHLFFIGLVQPQGSVWPLSEAQARLVGRHITGSWRLPADWKKRAYAEGEAIERHFLKRPRHALEVHFFPYLRQLQNK